MPAMALGGKRNPVIGSDPLRHAILAKGCRKYGLHLLRIRLFHALTTQQVTAVRIGHRQRINPLSLSSQEPALEVRTPCLVSLFYLLEWLAVHRSLPPLVLRCPQPFPTQDVSKSAHRRPIDTLFRRQKTGPQLLGSPTRMRMLQLHNLLLDPTLGLVGMMARSIATVPQSS